MGLKNKQTIMKRPMKKKKIMFDEILKKEKKNLTCWDLIKKEIKYG